MMKDALVKDWMTRSVIVINPETTLPEADQLMVGHKVRRLPVVKEGKLVGIVTRNNLWGATYGEAQAVNIYELNYQIAKMTVARVMTLDPITISPEDTLGQAVNLMLDNKISGLPVVDETGAIVGIITESDIFRIMAQAWREPK
jgi:CBS domain-containing protein